MLLFLQGYDHVTLCRGVQGVSVYTRALHLMVDVSRTLGTKNLESLPVLINQEDAFFVSSVETRAFPPLLWYLPERTFSNVNNACISHQRLESVVHLCNAVMIRGTAVRRESLVSVFFSLIVEPDLKWREGGVFPSVGIGGENEEASWWDRNGCLIRGPWPQPLLARPRVLSLLHHTATTAVLLDYAAPERVYYLF